MQMGYEDGGIEEYVRLLGVMAESNEKIQELKKLLAEEEEVCIEAEAKIEEKETQLKDLDQKLDVKRQGYEAKGKEYHDRLIQKEIWYQNECKKIVASNPFVKDKKRFEKSLQAENDKLINDHIRESEKYNSQMKEQLSKIETMEMNVQKSQEIL